MTVQAPVRTEADTRADTRDYFARAHGYTAEEWSRQDRTLTRLAAAVSAFVVVWALIHGLWWLLPLLVIVALAVLVTHTR